MFRCRTCSAVLRRWRGGVEEGHGEGLRDESGGKIVREGRRLWRVENTAAHCRTL